MKHPSVILQSLGDVFEWKSYVSMFTYIEIITDVSGTIVQKIGLLIKTIAMCLDSDLAPLVHMLKWEILSAMIP